MQMRRLRDISARLISVISGRDVTTVEAHNYRHLLLSGVWFGPIDGGIFNFLPVFLARLGASASVVSLLTSGPSLIGIFAYLPGGAYTERHSDLVKLLVRAAFLSRVFYPLIALAPLLFPANYVPIIIALLWSLAALPNAVHVPAWTAMMQKAIPVQRRAKFNGTRWGLMALVSGAVIALFGLMLDRIAFPLGYQIVFMVSFGAALVNLYHFSKVQVPPFVRDADRGGAASANRGAGVSTLAQLREFLAVFTAHRSFVRYNIASIIYRLMLAVPAGLFSIYWVQSLRATDTWIGLRGTAGYATLVLGYWFWGRVTSRIGHRWLLILCGLGLALYPILTAWAPSFQWLLPVAALWGFSVAGIDIGLFDMLLISAPAGRAPSFAAAANMLTSIALTIGPLLGAALAGVVGTRQALLICGGLQIIGTLFFLLLPNRDQEQAVAV